MCIGKPRRSLHVVLGETQEAPGPWLFFCGVCDAVKIKVTVQTPSVWRASRLPPCKNARTNSGNYSLFCWFAQPPSYNGCMSDSLPLPAPGCPQCAKLAELVRQLPARVAQLEAEVRELRARLNTHSGNSSVPPSPRRRNTSDRFRESRNRTSETPISKRQTPAIGHHEHGE